MIPELTSDILGCPHACGGGPTLKVPVMGSRPLSPRMWGWTEVEGRLSVHRDPLSPRMWGWTGANQSERRDDRVVPTHVGVDRS